MRTWADDDPKAELMSRKRAAIVDAALRAFLDEGYAGSSVNRIAAEAGVSIKTLYRHFESKDDLFLAVIRELCDRPEDDGAARYAGLPPLEGLTAAGAELLEWTLSPRQLGLYRVLARDASRFPELGRRYEEEVIADRVRVFIASVAEWPREERDRIRDPRRAAHRFFALLLAEVLDDALLTGAVPDPARLRGQAADAARDLLALARAGRL